MAYSDVEPRIDAALRRVIMDTDGHFDECLVDKLFESIGKHRKHDTKSVLVPLNFEYYKDLNGSVNLARLLKYHSSVSSAGPLQNFAVISAFVQCLPQIVLRGKPQEITLALSHLLNIVNIELINRETDHGFIQLIEETHYDAPFGIQNIIHLIKYLLETTKVYHIQNLTKTIYYKLILGFQLRLKREDIFPHIHDWIIGTTKELLCDKDSRLMHLALLDLFKHADDDKRPCQVIDLIRPLKDIVKSHYQDLQKQQKVSTPNFDLLVKCVSYTDSQPNIEIVEQLMVRDKLDAIIMYVTSDNWRPFMGQDRLLRVFILYPILARCHKDGAHVPTEVLIVSSEEKNFIQRNLKDKHVLQCLTYLHQTLNRCGDHLIGSEWTVRALKIALEYLKCNINSAKDLKNLSVCCHIMKSHRIMTLDEGLKSDWYSGLVDTIINVLVQIDYNSFPNKPIFFQMIQLIAQSNDTRRLLKRGEGNLDKLIEMALKVTDPDVLNELTQIYHGIEATMWRPPSNDVVSPKYSELIKNHILPIARDTNHHELISYAASLLICVEIKSGVRVTQIDSPKIIGDLLIENSHVFTIAHKIIQSIRDSQYLRRLPEVSGQPDICDHIFKGICTVLMSDSLTGHDELSAFILIDETIREIVISNESSKWERLASMSAFDLLLKIHSCSLYEEGSEMKVEMKQRSCDLIEYLRLTGSEFEKFIKHQTDGSDKFAQIFAPSKSKDTPILSDQDPEQVAPGLWRSDHNLNKLGLNSYLDDILNDDLVSQMAECY